MKKILTLIILFGAIFSVHAQKVAFQGVNLGCPTFEFLSQLKKLGFRTENNTEFLYGSFAGIPCRAYLNPNSTNAKELVLFFGEPEQFYYDLKTGNEVVEILTNKIVSQYANPPHVAHDVPVFGSCYGNSMFLDNGYISIYHDYSVSTLKGSVVIRLGIVEM